MADLFDQLKSGVLVKKLNLSPAKSVSSPKSNYTNTLNPFDGKQKSKSSTILRESLASKNKFLKKSKLQKARSLSPKHSAKNVLKSVKVKLERKNIKEFLPLPLEEHANDLRKNEGMIKNIDKSSIITPTKAQQKLFETMVDEKNLKDHILKKFNIKPCKVRLHRDNLQKITKELKYKSVVKSKTKRLAPAGFFESPPPKKVQPSAVDNKSFKNRNNFFIKLNTSPPSKLEKKLKNISRSSPSSEAFHNKIKNSKFNTTTAPTKFSRSELFRSFGKRFFNVQVKIERCTHPLLLTFESNDRARRLQGKRNKSKNLSVSFSEQVEIFGGSSEEDDSCGEDFCAVATNRNSRKSIINNSLSFTVTPVVMPARLKKVENGKVIDDIELDPTLFLDPKLLISSTPFPQGRKKRDHKSFSPLKDENSPSPRKEKLKLANEGIPPGGLKRLNMDDDDDEDDDCEYIVPIEMPQRRTSRTSSNTTPDDLTIVSLPVDVSSMKFPETFNNVNINLATTKKVTETKKHNTNITEKKKDGTSLSVIHIDIDSDDSFISANDNLEENNRNISDGNQFPSLRYPQISDFQLELGRNKSHGIEQLQQANGNVCNEISSKHLSTLNSVDDISMNLFLEDSQTNEDDTNAKSFVDNLINDTIDKLTKDIDESATDKHYSDTT